MLKNRIFFYIIDFLFLATIWQSAVDVCEDVLESQKSQGQSIISSYLWRQKFYFQNMLHQIADEYRFK